jgi:hypothetical protein
MLNSGNNDRVKRAESDLRATVTLGCPRWLTPDIQDQLARDKLALPEISILRGCSINHPPANPATGKCTGKCTCAIWWYIKLFKIGILGNLPIAHNSLWVLEVMFIKKIRIWEHFTLYIWGLKFDLGPKSKPFKIFRVNMYRKKCTQIQ